VTYLVTRLPPRRPTLSRSARPGSRSSNRSPEQHRERKAAASASQSTSRGMPRWSPGHWPATPLGAPERLMPARAAAAVFAPRDVVSRSLTIEAASAGGTMLICSGAVLRLPRGGSYVSYRKCFQPSPWPPGFPRTWWADFFRACYLGSSTIPVARSSIRKVDEN
jgi:hypothetical protein